MLIEFAVLTGDGERTRNWHEEFRDREQDYGMHP